MMRLTDHLKICNGGIIFMAKKQPTKQETDRLLGEFAAATKTLVRDQEKEEKEIRDKLK